MIKNDEILIKLIYKDIICDYTPTNGSNDRLILGIRVDLKVYFIALHDYGLPIYIQKVMFSITSTIFFLFICRKILAGSDSVFKNYMLQIFEVTYEAFIIHQEM